MNLRLVSLGGLLLMLLLAWLLSENRRRINARVIAWGLGLQLLLALLVLRTEPGRVAFRWVEAAFARLVEFSDAGATFVFGSLATDAGYGALVAFHVLPIIIFVSSLSAVLYHLGIIQKVVKGMAWLMQRTMKISGAESVGSALLVFMGIESVTAIGKYVEQMTRSELFVIMTAFLATIATSVMAAYVSFGASAGHLLAASLMSAPAAIVIAKVMVPETEEPVTAGRVEFEPEVTTLNVLDAAASGAAQGVRLALNIAAMLIAFVALIAMVNFFLEWITGHTLQEILGLLFGGLAATMGVPRSDWMEVGQLLGIKTVLNEFLAYQQMQEMMGEGLLTARGHTISTYALCGFANFGSVAILIGGLSGVAPGRRSEVAGLGIKALVAGTLAAFMTACYAGLLA